MTYQRRYRLFGDLCNQHVVMQQLPADRLLPPAIFKVYIDLAFFDDLKQVSGKTATLQLPMCWQMG
jgi:hypothetical protein